jgi:internalin A
VLLVGSYCNQPCNRWPNRIPCLRHLELHHTALSDAGLKELAGLNQLRFLDVNSTKITDAGLKELAGLKNLRELRAFNTKVTDAGGAALQKELPTCKILR